MDYLFITRKNANCALRKYALQQICNQCTVQRLSVSRGWILQPFTSACLHANVTKWIVISFARGMQCGAQHLIVSYPYPLPLLATEYKRRKLYTVFSNLSFNPFVLSGFHYLMEDMVIVSFNSFILSVLLRHHVSRARSSFFSLFPIIYDSLPYSATFHTQICIWSILNFRLVVFEMSRFSFY